MITETQVVQFDSIPLDCGTLLAPVDVAYETYGELNASKTNAILVLHAFSGDAHAAGEDKETGSLGWWDDMLAREEGSIPTSTSSFVPMCFRAAEVRPGQVRSIPLPVARTRWRSRP